MSYYGYHQRGDDVYVPLAALSEEGIPVTVDNAPLCLIFNPSGVLEKQFTVPKMGSMSDIWHFASEYFLGKNSPLGKYTVIFAYDDAPDYYITSCWFDVYDTGDSHGNSISMIPVKFESVKYVVSQLTSGSIVRGRVNE